MKPLILDVPNTIHLFVLIILLGGTVCALLRRHQPVGAGLFAGAVGIWLAAAAPWLSQLPALLSSFSCAAWSAAGMAAGLLILLLGLAARHTTRHTGVPR